jgi:hypothetical protein
MLFKDTALNPLPALFELIGEGGIVITTKTIPSIAKVLNTGGIIAETEKELITILHLFIEWYGLLEIVVIDNIHYLRKVNGKNSQ